MVVCVKLPDVPVIVIVKVPRVALLATVNVNVLVEVAGFGLNDAVTPLCIPEAERLTLPLNPFDGVIVMVLVPRVPRESDKLFGEADKLKSAAATGFTVSVIVVVCVKLPDVPVTVTLTVPVAAVLLTVNVSALVFVAGFGLNAAVTPLGKPEADRLTLPVNPFDGVMAMVLEPLLP